MLPPKWLNTNVSLLIGCTTFCLAGLAGQSADGANRAGGLPKPPPGDTVRAMTFNIRFANPRDGRNRWARRSHLVVDRIRSFRPDLLAVQEALHHQVVQLQTALPEFEALGVHRRGGTEDEACKLFVRASRLAIEAQGTFWLSPTPDTVGSRGWGNTLPRICTWAVLRDRRWHHRFVVANTHFDHLSPTARRESARLISAWSKIFKLPVLVLGDFNAGEGSWPIRWLKRHGLRDTFRVVHPHDRDAGTANGFRQRGSSKIDYVFASKAFEVHRATIDKKTFDGRFPSDHCAVTATLSLPAKAPPTLMPTIAGAAWRIGDNPSLGALQGPRQQVVDHAIFRSLDGRWQMWACVRGTAIGRLLYRWEGHALSQRHWLPLGIAMRRSRPHGESLDDWGGKEWIQAPHVTRHDGRFYLLFGGHRSELEHCQINLAISPDGRTFRRHQNALGQSRVFVGPGEARDPMVLRVGDRFLCYYTGNPDPNNRRDKAGIYCRTSKDLIEWSEPRRVCYGGSAGEGMWSAECPHVVRREGAFYLFRTTQYRPPVTHVYRSTDPFDFGLDDDRFRLGTIAVSAPEVVTDQGRDFISSVHDLDGGVQLMRLRWRAVE